MLLFSFVWVGLFACAPTFPVARERLGPLRIAGVAAPDGVLRAAVWSGEGPFHSEAPTLRWWVDGAPAGTGWEVAAPAAGAEVRLEVRTAAGEERAAVWVAAASPPAFSLTRATVSPGADLSVEARRGWEATPVADGAGPDAALRLGADLPDDSTARVYWRIEDGAGTVLALNEREADVLAEEVVFDDGEVASRAPLERPLAPLVQAFALGAAGGSRWVWAHAPFADGAVDGLARVGELRLPFAATAPGLWAVTLSGVSAAGVGSFDDPVPVDTLDTQDPLACAPAGQPFDFGWAIEGRCGADELDGRRVVLEVR